MSTERVSYFIDGSYMFKALGEMKKSRPEFAGRRFNVSAFANAMQIAFNPYAPVHVRSTFYFKPHDARVSKLLHIPDKSLDTAGEHGHWQVKYCGINVSDNLPSALRDKLSLEELEYLAKGEKGLDMALACDALQLIAHGRIASCVLMVNDRDYLPLVEAIQNLGANVYAAKLSRDQPLHPAIAELVDGYVSLDDYLAQCFEPPATQTSIDVEPKPDSKTQVIG